MSIVNRYTALSIYIQLVACVQIFIVAFAFSPVGDSYFLLMPYFYLPVIFLVAAVLPLDGESGMIAAGVFGIGCGTIIYGAIFGLVVSYIKKHRRKSKR